MEYWLKYFPRFAIQVNGTGFYLWNIGLNIFLGLKSKQIKYNFLKPFLITLLFPKIDLSKINCPFLTKKILVALEIFKLLNKCKFFMKNLIG